ncbi:MAG: putative glycoside hydrolase [Candidatus Falkowbacteria bacterium]
MNKITKIITIISFLTLLLPLSANAESLAISPKNPRLANYFLKWTIEDNEVAQLAKWDVLILDMDVQENSRANLQKIRQLNPKIKILAYIGSQEANADIYSNQWAKYGVLKKRLVDNIPDGWWMKDSSGARVSFWPGNYLLNVSDGCLTNTSGQRWNDYLPQFVSSQILSTGLWDGVFYDSLWGDVTWFKRNLDIDNNKNISSEADINNKWSSGMKEIIAKTRDINAGKNYIILGNANVFFPYQSNLNGMMLEGFPSAWEAGGTWSGSMTTYAKLGKINLDPKITILNSFNKNQNDFAKMRFGLASTLLDDHGYYSYDYDVSNHGQLWWYDEYDVSLGNPTLPAYNVLDKTNTTYKPGLWRRDYENGIVIVNSTKDLQRYIFTKEEFEKINGTQDRSVNNGTIINYIKINPGDGIVLLRRKSDIVNTSFYNGNFVRVFNYSGQQVRNGFFSYLDSFPGGNQIIKANIDGDKSLEYLSDSQGKILLTKDGKRVKNFEPYGKLYKGNIFMAISDFDNNGKYEIISGTGKGGSSQVVVMGSDGKIINSFFAYDKKFKGGVSVASGNIGGDSKKEIVTGAGPGGGPEIRIFSQTGQLFSKFMAYDKNFKGGVSVAVGDVNGDGQNEIVTGAGAGGGPEVRIFDKNGKLLKKFMAYDANIKTGVKVSVEDIDNNGTQEILVSSANF